MASSLARRVQPLAGRLYLWSLRAQGRATGHERLHLLPPVAAVLVDRDGSTYPGHVLGPHTLYYDVPAGAVVVGYRWPGKRMIPLIEERFMAAGTYTITEAIA